MILTGAYAKPKARLRYPNDIQRKSAALSDRFNALIFSSEASKAIGQCHRYLDVFSKVASDGLLGNEQIAAYHPEATIVIGRSVDWDESKKFAAFTAAFSASV